jgi:transposase
MSQRESWATRANEIQSLLNDDVNPEDIAAKYQVSRKTFMNRLAELRNLGLITDPPKRVRQDKPVESEPGYKESLEIYHDGTHKSDKLLKMSVEQSKDVNHLLDAHGYDKDAWELISARNNIWNAYSKLDGIMTMYASKITVKPREVKYDEEKMQEFFIRLSRDYQSPVHTPTNYKSDGKLLELNVADLHLGKLAWSGDSGDTYNHEIARERFYYIINDVITRVQTYGLERILFVWCNDFFHFDGPGKMTTNGTPQDSSMQYEQMFELGCEMLIKGIDLLEQVAPVTTMYVASNHDRLVSFFATKYLYAWYRNNPNITIDSRALSRKAVRFGKCLIGFTHGDKEKSRIGKWMQVEYAKDWGESIFREVHAAHIHSEKSIDEDNGQIIRYVSSPTGTDRWHHNSAYVGAIQKAQTFIWDREMGLEDTKNTPILISSPVLEGMVL